MKRGKDVLERLMEMGLMPLAALDHIRGWLLLEMAAASDEDRRLIKAATRNRLTYSEVRTALLGMFEEKVLNGNPKGYGRPGAQRAYLVDPEYDGTAATDYAWANWQDPEYDPSTYDPDAEWDDWNNQYWGEEAEADPWFDGQEQLPDETLLRLQEEQSEMEKQRQELEMMLSETDRNLVEARRAVAAAAKDRGWTGTVQQRQPRSTSTFPFQNKGKSKGKAMSSRGHLQNHWMQGKGRGKPKGRHGKGFSKHNTFHMLSVDLPPEEMLFNPVQASGSADRGLPTESLVDTGATATAGGKSAVRDFGSVMVVGVEHYIG